MNQNGSKDGSCHVKPDIQRYHVKPHVHSIAEQPNGQDCNTYTTDKGIENLPSCIKLQMLLIPGSNTGDTYNHECCNLTPNKIPIQIDEPPFDSVMNIANYAAPVVEQFRVNGILEKLQE